MSEVKQAQQEAVEQVEPVQFHTPHAAEGRHTHHAWAKVEDGKVSEIKVVHAHLPHPYAEHEAAGGRVVNVTSVPCGAGYVVDTHGNVAPPPVRAADATLVAPTMPAPGAQAAAVQAEPVEDHAISMDEANERREALPAPHDDANGAEGKESGFASMDRAAEEHRKD